MLEPKHMRHFLANTLEATRRRQAVLCAATDRMTRQHFEGPADEYFWSTLRGELLAAGATDADVHAVAAVHVAHVVEAARCQLDRCAESVETILEHLTGCQEVEIRTRAGVVVAVTFGDGNRVH